MTDRSRLAAPTDLVPRVLIVDDEPRFVRSLQLVLSGEFDVSTTTDPFEALRWLTSGSRYDVILCDVMMPALNGAELHERVRAHSAEVAARFVFVTGGVWLSEVRMLIDRASNVVLAKPFDSGALRELIRQSARGVPAFPDASRP